MNATHDLPQTRPPIDRMMQIHSELAAGKFPNCSTLARRIEVSPKTIQRDLDFMRDRMNLLQRLDVLDEAGRRVGGFQCSMR